MTATPRHYNVLKRDKEGEAKLVYSMDVPESYGSVVHKLPFAEAARAGIICRYKVLISVVTSEMVGQELLKSGKVLVKGDEIYAQQVANQLALAAAVEKHGVGKIITFHKNIKSAQSFTAAGAEGITNHLKNFSVFHVNGSMPSAEREKLMGEFKNSKHGLISNAKCLTEGVDVPAVDMVAFLSPKRSTVDIVQATGRAMRKAPGKEVGYILVPLYLETKKGETIEDAVQRGKFEEVWDVLAALQEQDEVLADIIRQMREERGRTKGFNDTRFRDLVEIVGQSISLDSLRSSITTACIENLGAFWDERFGELVAYKAKYGNCNVPHIWPKSPSLGLWVAAQRRNKDRLDLKDVQRLNGLGFEWDPRAALWEENIEALKAYRSKNGNCNVPSVWAEKPELGIWVANQRHRKDILSPENVERAGFNREAQHIA
jgi:predicted helicase